MDDNIKFMELSHASHESLQKGEYGEYRNSLFSMSEILRKEKKYQDQLKLLLLVFYIDLAGYSSLEQCKFMLDESFDFPFFPITPIIAPGISRNIRIAADRLSMDFKSVISYYRTIVSDSMLPAHLYSVKESEKFLKICLSDGVDSANLLIKKRKKFKIINIK